MYIRWFLCVFSWYFTIFVRISCFFIPQPISSDSTAAMLISGNSRRSHFFLYCDDIADVIFKLYKILASFLVQIVYKLEIIDNMHDIRYFISIKDSWISELFVSLVFEKGKMAPLSAQNIHRNDKKTSISSLYEKGNMFLYYCILEIH